MPDLISHIGSGYLAAAGYRRRNWMALFLFATTLPDLATRPLYIILPQSYWFLKPLHTPLGLLLLCFALSGLFAQQARNRVFLLLLAGCALHLLLDLFQKHLHGGYPLLFPLSWETFEIGLLWPAQTLYFIPVWFFVIFMIIMRRRSGRRKSGRSVG